jgi:hypothetical protein
MPLIDEDELARLVRETVHREIARPLLISQRNVEQVIGLPRRDYLRLARAGEFPSCRERRLVLARTADVLAVFEKRIAVQSTRPANLEQGSRMAAAGWKRVAP